MNGKRSGGRVTAGWATAWVLGGITAGSATGCAAGPRGSADAAAPPVQTEHLDAAPSVASAGTTDAPATRGGAAGLPTAAEPPPASAEDAAKARASFAAAAAALGRPGVYRTPDVYVVTVPRDDLTLAVDGMPVPAAAGIESAFHFYYCPCGKTVVVGQVAAQDHELNDVIDALRAGKIEVVSAAPMLLHARGAPHAVRLYAEGKPDEIGRALREALRWTGKERMAPAGR